MGSGLILLLIVGAWLAVLVPMALRSHDAGSSSRATERFGDAMRVLSRRSASAPVAAPGGALGDCDSFGGESSLLTAEPELPPFEAMLRSERNAPPAPLTPLQRRRRVLAGLVGGSAFFLLASLLVGPMLWVGLVLVALTVADVAYLRHLALQREARRWAAYAAAEPLVELPVVHGIPDRMPARPAPLMAPAARWEEAVVAPSRWDEPLPAAVGGEWQPVPVPLPVYATKPVAPPRAPRVLETPAPGVWTASSDLELDGEPDVELDEILERRRAVGGW